MRRRDPPGTQVPSRRSLPSRGRVLDAVRVLARLVGQELRRERELVPKLPVLLIGRSLLLLAPVFDVVFPIFLAVAPFLLRLTHADPQVHIRSLAAPLA